MRSQPEVWLRGPIDKFPLDLQPVVHAILQAQEEIHVLMKGFPVDLLWEKPAGMASPAFHLQHIAGVLDRMATYAKAETLSEQQFNYLKEEGNVKTDMTVESLVEQLDIEIAEFLQIISAIDPGTLTDFRGVGRAQLPSTVGGLLFHAAEHTQRHFGQLLVTVNILRKK
ncbi:DinB family protein [Algoriphagus resistens]|uniref:DinB family protein n=1 Tax=Algoriphagus resistens TaxID=1750590 RepID=UPI000716B30D|nr:DinB family protein [Algoriphagus resistens]